MHSTHAQSPSSDRPVDEVLAVVLDVVRSVVGHEVRPQDRLEADLAIDSIDLARISAALPYDVQELLARFDFDRLTALTVADLAPDLAAAGAAS